MAKKKIVVKREKVKPLKKKREISEEAREKMRDRLAAMRAKKKPADYKNISESVLALPDDDKYSFRNVKAWIRKSKDLVADYNKTARGMRFTPQEKQRASMAADHKKAYIRDLEYYLKTGDFISYFSGEDETNKVIPKCVAMAYYEDGTPKRSAGVYYPDINMVWKQDMIEVDYAPVQTISQTVAMTDKQFDSNL